MLTVEGEPEEDLLRIDVLVPGPKKAPHYITSL
jgi:hypothetical protein